MSWIRKSAKKAAAPKPSSKKYRATLLVFGRKFIGVGPTVSEAIADVKPGKVGGPGVQGRLAYCAATVDPTR